jgi:hypothetical protein
VSRARLIVCLALGGCAPVVSTAQTTDRPRATIVVDARETKHCLRVAVGRWRGDRDWPAGATAPPELARHLAEVPADVRRTARAAGLEPLLAELLDARGDPTRAEEIETTRDQAVLRLSALEIELAAVLFEADCVGDQMEAVLVELDDRQRRQEIGIAIASVVLGATAGIVSGAVDLAGHTPTAIGIGIGGGTASAALGLGAFAKRRDRVIFDHERNLLTPIRDGEDPEHMFPTFVFHMLTHARAGQPTPREEILEGWRAILEGDLESDERVMAEAVLYGEGGTYDGNLVHVREQMFDVMESHLNAIESDLERLYAYFGGLFLERKPAG